MPKNDKLLVDQVISDAAKDRGHANTGSFFQQFAIEQLLKDLELSGDEIELGIIDGRDDGGIDAWYTLLDGEFLSDETDIPNRRGVSSLEVLIFTCKHHDTFKLEPVVSLFTTVNELFDLSVDDSALASRYNEDILASRAIFKQALVMTAQSNPRLSFKFYYVSRGDAEAVGDAIKARSDALITSMKSFFSDPRTSFSYVGAEQLLSAFRKLKDFSAHLAFEEGPISRGATNYVGLATLKAYFQFITDPNGKLKRYLFESNVRDYMGHNDVNNAIENTLNANTDPMTEDFWWLNNGATIIASWATVIGKELHLRNVQIVNGLQTTETIYSHMVKAQPAHENRCILVKVLITESKVLADKIILATNNQSKVDSASLRSTDKIQRDIEDILLTRGWFYDRRKNFHANHGRPHNRIVSISYMSWAIMALKFRKPYNCGRTRPKYLRDNAAYRSIFDERADIEVFPAVLQICKAVEEAMRSLGFSCSLYSVSNFASLYRFFYATLYTAYVSRQQHCSDKQLIEMAAAPIDHSALLAIHDVVNKSWKQLSPNARRLHRSRDFQEPVLKEVLSIVGALKSPRGYGPQLAETP